VWTHFFVLGPGELLNISSTMTARAVSPGTKSCSVLFKSTNVEMRLHSDTYFASYRNSGATAIWAPPPRNCVVIALLSPSGKNRFAITLLLLRCERVLIALSFYNALRCLQIPLQSCRIRDASNTTIER
jgi:hypothetical protein